MPKTVVTYSGQEVLDMVRDVLQERAGSTQKVEKAEFKVTPAHDYIDRPIPGQYDVQLVIQIQSVAKQEQTNGPGV